MHKEDFDGTKCVCYKPDKTDIFIPVTYTHLDVYKRQVRTFNEGMAANVLDEDPAKVKKISSLVLVIFLILSLPLFFSKKGRINRKLGAALIIGGALSNVADRCIRGKVVDYIQFNMDKSDRMERMTYNIADFSIFIGTVLYMINSDSKKSKKNNKK